MYYNNYTSSLEGLYSHSPDVTQYLYKSGLAYIVPAYTLYSTI